MTIITERLRSRVIEEYMDFKSLDEIATITNLSKGSVYNIIKQWKSQLDKGDIDEIRKFKNTLKKLDVTITDCILGLRIVKMLKKFNIKDDFDDPFTDLDFDKSIQQEKLNNSDFQGIDSNISPDNFKDNEDWKIRGKEILSFLSEIYVPCKRNNIKSADIMKWVQDLLKNFSHVEKFEIPTERCFKNNSPSNKVKSVEISLVTQVNTFLDGKKREHLDLKTKNSDLNKRLDIVSNIIVEKSNKLDKINKEEKLKLQYLDWYKALEYKLKNRFNIKIDEVLDNFANMINDFKDYAFDALRIIGECRKTNSLKSQREIIESELNKKVAKRDRLQSELTNIKFDLVFSQQTLSAFYELCSMGWGRKELKHLTATITEIATQNNISTDEALKKFLLDVENDYDSKLGFENVVKNLEVKKKEIEQEIPGYKNYIQLKAVVGASIYYLKSKGVIESDIIGIAELVHYAIDNNLLPNYDNDSEVVKSYPFYFLMQEIARLKRIRSEFEELSYKRDAAIREINELSYKRDAAIREIREIQSRRQIAERAYIEHISALNNY